MIEGIPAPQQVPPQDQPAPRPNIEERVHDWAGVEIGGQSESNRELDKDRADRNTGQQEPQRPRQGQALYPPLKMSAPVQQAEPEDGERERREKDPRPDRQLPKPRSRVGLEDEIAGGGQGGD